MLPVSVLQKTISVLESMILLAMIPLSPNNKSPAIYFVRDLSIVDTPFCQISLFHSIKSDMIIKTDILHKNNEENR